MRTFQEAESWSNWGSNYSPKSCGLARLFCLLFHGGKRIWEIKCVPRCPLNKFVSPCFWLSCLCHTQLPLCEEERGRLCLELIQRCRRKRDPYFDWLWAASRSQAGFPGMCLGWPSNAYINLTSTCDLYFESWPSLCSKLLVWSVGETVSWWWKSCLKITWCKLMCKYPELFSYEGNVKL